MIFEDFHLHPGGVILAQPRSKLDLAVGGVEATLPEATNRKRAKHTGRVMLAPAILGRYIIAQGRLERVVSGFERFERVGFEPVIQAAPRGLGVFLARL